MAKFIKQVGGVLTEELTTGVSTGVGDAGKVVNLDANGKLDTSLLPAGVGQEYELIVASEALAAGDFVNVYDDAGTPKVRKADASSINTEANGFVLAAVALNGTATVYFEGTNNQLTGLTPGKTYFLSETSGVATLTAPSTAGAIVQVVGRSAGTTKISFEPGSPIVLA